MYYACKYDPAVVRSKADSCCMCRSEGVNYRLTRVTKKQRLAFLFIVRHWQEILIKSFELYLLQIFFSLKNSGLHLPLR